MAERRTYYIVHGSPDLLGRSSKSEAQRVKIKKIK